MSESQRFPYKPGLFKNEYIHNCVIYLFLELNTFIARQKRKIFHINDQIKVQGYRCELEVSLLKGLSVSIIQTYK